VRVEILEEFGKFSHMVEFPGCYLGDDNELGLLCLHFFELLL